MEQVTLDDLRRHFQASPEAAWGQGLFLAGWLAALALVTYKAIRYAGSPSVRRFRKVVLFGCWSALILLCAGVAAVLFCGEGVPHYIGFTPAPLVAVLMGCGMFWLSKGPLSSEEGRDAGPNPPG